VDAETGKDGKTCLPVAEPVETGDLLVLDPARPGLLRRVASTAELNVVGIAAGPSREAQGGGLEAPMAEGRYALVRADVGYGKIRPGDPLARSPTPGHAMRADDPRPGAIIGKTLAPLEAGAGVIEALVTLR
jgi:hypothetical protein